MGCSCVKKQSQLRLPKGISCSPAALGWDHRRRRRCPMRHSEQGRVCETKPRWAGGRWDCGSRIMDGRAPAEYAKQSQTWEGWDVWRKINSMRLAVGLGSRACETKPTRWTCRVISHVSGKGYVGHGDMKKQSQSAVGALDVGPGGRYDAGDPLAFGWRLQSCDHRAERGFLTEAGSFS